MYLCIYHIKSIKTGICKNEISVQALLYRIYHKYASAN